MGVIPILTVIIPVYNTAKYLKRCLDSVINQSIHNIEIICINDGSIDDSLYILEKYKDIDDRIKIISKENEGLSVARNVGISLASGKYITFVDSDDYIETNSYELALQYFNSYEVDAVYFSTNLVYENHSHDINQEKYYEHKYQGIIDLTPDILNNMDVSAWNKIYKHELIKRYEIKFPVGLLYEDNPFFWSYMLVSNKVYFMNEKLYNYTIRDGSIMRLTSIRNMEKLGKYDNGLDKLFCFEYLLKFIFKWNLFSKIDAVLCDLLEKNLWDGLYYAKKNSRKKVLQKATDLVNKFRLIDIYPTNPFIISLYKKNYSQIKNVNSLFLNLRQRIIGVWKTDKYYIICFLGVKIKVKTKSTRIKKN